MAEEGFVKVPSKMYEQLEARSKRLSEIEQAMGEVVRVMKDYRISTVVTIPPTGSDAAEVNAAVRHLVHLARS